jgi:hypothetical protein
VAAAHIIVEFAAAPTAELSAAMEVIHQVAAVTNPPEYVEARRMTTKDSQMKVIRVKRNALQLIKH